MKNCLKKIMYEVMHDFEHISSWRISEEFFAYVHNVRPFLSLSLSYKVNAEKSKNICINLRAFIEYEVIILLKLIKINCIANFFSCTDYSYKLVSARHYNTREF